MNIFSKITVSSVICTYVITTSCFQMSMCSAPLRELGNPGASGSIFYLTNDDEFIIKTVQHKEGEFLQKLLPGYYLNLDQVTIIRFKEVLVSISIDAIDDSLLRLEMTLSV